MPTPTDQPARDAVAECLDETMFVEAGAGSGKTKSLVDRYVALVTDPTAPVAADGIAAITFTEKAAGELADRVRARLQASAPEALADLDRAAICTLHAFAQRILTAFPIEAGLPPRITVLDEIASQLAFEARWERFVDRIIEEPALELPLRLLLASGAKLEQLHEVALKLGQSWDLVAERTGRVTGSLPRLDLSALYAEVEGIVAMTAHCHTRDDLLDRIDQIAAWCGRLEAAPDDDLRLELLRYSPNFRVGHTGSKDNWTGITAVRGRVRALADLCVAARERVSTACLDRIVDELSAFTVTSALERQAAGELEFHDLLVLARRVLRDETHGVAVRAALRDHYQRLLLDEFQDTDPIQVELAVLIASSDPDAAAKDWWDVEPDPGRLFFVGDPKQSIYRFRRADIRVFLRARNHVGGRVERLTTNFRTTAPILEWVNRTFGALIEEEGESQPAYVVLDPHRAPDPSSSAPHVAYLGVEPHEGKVLAADLRQWEAEDVARAVREAYADGWTVQDEVSGEWRPTTWRDIAILLPARTSLRQLERALEKWQVPYRAETSSLVYGTREVRDLLMIARAVEDPTDGLAVVAALRTPAFACGDDDLLVWRRELRNGWDHQRDFRDGTPSDHVVARGLTWLRDLHRERYWLSPSQVLDRIVRDRRLLEVAYVHPRPRDLWRRLRFVVDQCRAWEESGGGTLRDYLRWVKLQSAEGSRVVETVLPETDDEAVRILTVHGAKGLEFPITVLSGMTTELGSRRNGVQVLYPEGSDRIAVKLKSDLATEEYELAAPIEEQMDEKERLRLLYVAATRARDHLIVSVHRRPNDGPKTAAGLFYDHGWDPNLVTAMAFLSDAPTDAPTTTAFALDAVTLPPFDEWQTELTAARAHAMRPTAISATRLAELAESERLAGLQKEPRDIDLPPWQKGRYGSAIGRAVHGVMQSVDLTLDSPPDALVAAQAAAEGVEGHEPTIKRLCENALASDVVKRAATRRHWREVYVGVPDEQYGVLEGYIDLLYEDDDGLVIVDYKTDAWSNEAELDEKVERYAVQLDAYADAVSEAVGEPVVREVLLFAHSATSRNV